jgi:glycosyl transferase family 25
MKRLHLQFERVAACDAEAVSERWLDRHFVSTGPLGALPKGDRCCAISHQRAWLTFLSSGESHGVILEDDVAIDPAAAHLLRRSDWIPAHAALVKLEHFGPRSQRVLVGEACDLGGGRSIAEIHSRHTGAGAYILSREAASILVNFPERWSISVDHILFNPNLSPIASKLRPLQLLPAIARQDPVLGGVSDIAASRLAQRRPTLAYFRREIVRAYYEMRLLPRQLLRLLMRRGALVRVGNDMLLQAQDLRFADTAAAHSGQN